MNQITITPSLTEETTIVEVINVELGRRVSFIFTSKEPIEVRDEYHSMRELYDHRMALNIALFQAWKKDYECIKSKLHNDGTMFEDYFIVMAQTPVGQISYHYKLDYWDMFDLTELERAFPWDGHTPNDVLERLMKL